MIVWNQTRKRDRWGIKRQSPRSRDEVIRVEAEALRIVPEDLWRTARERLDAGRALYFARNKGRAFGRPPSSIDSPYLLTGLATCAVCGGSMCVLTRSHGHQRVPFWGCMVRKQRGRAVCPNTLEVPLEATDYAVLKAVEHDVLSVEVLETALAKALEALQPNVDHDSAEQTLRGELARIEAEVARLATAIAAGGELAALLAALQDRERRRIHLRGERPHLTVNAPPRTAARTWATFSTNCVGTLTTGRHYCGKRPDQRAAHCKAC